MSVNVLYNYIDIWRQ